MGINVAAVALELASAYDRRFTNVAPLTSRGEPFDLDAAYAVEAELVRTRRAFGRTTVGRKVGYANKALWRALKLDTLVWARMYDDTVQTADANRASLSLHRMASPRLEPEIVFRLRRAPDPAATDATAILDAVEWLALGFEIVDCVFADWTFKPADFVAAYGLHAALIVGTPVPLDATNTPAIAERLATFPLRLTRNGAAAAQGSGRNSLRSPALCLGELAAAIARRPGMEPLAAGELVSSGSLTEAQPLAPGEVWTAAAEELGLPDLTLSVIP